ncbi:hypothetical protein [Pandoraea oxalativorans]|uniref:Uncharacterized protein n=1 Tax=Pandoraea oxalativorans TaxID=573737 RepID=A0A0G3IIB7_9BURK|nr:hypothetical protein [Pandoraea oxalativorans]AKK24855.1 hypothetical protein MB84_29225 [Pandoraea oxalativorans]
MQRVSDSSGPVFVDGQRPAQERPGPSGAPTARNVVHVRVEVSWGEDRGYLGSDADGPSQAEIMMALTRIRDMLREVQLAYAQNAQWNGGQLRLEELKLKLDAALEAYKAKDAQAWGQIEGGATAAVAGLLSTYGAATGSALQHVGDVGRGLDGVLQGYGGLKGNEHSLEEQKMQVAAEYLRAMFELLSRTAADGGDAAKRYSDAGNNSLQSYIHTVQQMNNAALGR